MDSNRQRTARIAFCTAIAAAPVLAITNLANGGNPDFLYVVAWFVLALAGTAILFRNRILPVHRGNRVFVGVVLVALSALSAFFIYAYHTGLA